MLEIFKESPSNLFYELREHNADVFNDELIPTVPIKRAVEYYDAFYVTTPESVLRKGHKLEVVYKHKMEKIQKAKIFTNKPTKSDDEIEEKRKKVQAPNKEPELNNKLNRKPGRPIGSKNKKTLEKEAKLKKLGITPPLKAYRTPFFLEVRIL